MIMTTGATQSFKRFGIAAVGGVVYFLGWAGFGFWQLSLLCLIPLWMALESCPHKTWRHSMFIGWFYGWVAYAGGCHWITEFLNQFSGFNAAMVTLLWLIFAAYLGFSFAIYALIYHTLRTRGVASTIIAVPVLIIIEWLYPLLFPTYLANAFQNQIGFIQIADLGGPLLVSALAGLFNLSIYELIRAQGKITRTVLKVGSLTAVALAVSYLYGIVRIDQIETQIASQPALQIGTVQANISIDENRTRRRESRQRHIEQSLQLQKADNLDLIVWPESAVNVTLPDTTGTNTSSILRSVTTPVLFGGRSSRIVDGRRRVYNSAFFVDENNFVKSVHNKTHLLMFGEYLPFAERFPWLYKISPNTRKFTAGSKIHPVKLDQWRLAILICYEDTLPGFTRKSVLQTQPHLLVNLTNDAWFGETEEPAIHLALSRFRAIESRRYLLRAANTGISAIIDPMGRVQQKTNAHRRESFSYSVPMLDNTTVYTRLGDWPGWLALATLVGLLLRSSKNKAINKTSR